MLKIFIIEQQESPHNSAFEEWKKFFPESTPNYWWKMCWSKCSSTAAQKFPWDKLNGNFGAKNIKKSKEKGEKTRLEQDFLRKKVKMAKALNDDIFYKDFAEYLNITEHSFYNWIKGYYDLSSQKASKLNEVVVDLIGWKKR